MTQLCDNVHIVGGLVDVIQLDNVLVTDFFHDVDLGLDVLHVVGVGKYPLVDYFDCHLFVGLDMFA